MSYLRKLYEYSFYLTRLAITPSMCMSASIEMAFSVGDDDADYCVTLLNGVDNILSGYDFAEHGMFAIQMRGRQMCNEKLTTVGIWTCVGH